jgi:putative chitobiose transport system permease protein
MLGKTQLERRQKLIPYFFLLPALIALSVTLFFPAIQAFSLSFAKYEYDLTQMPQWVGLANFQRLLGDRIFWQTIINTLLYIMGVVPILVIVPLILAIVVNRKLKGIYWFRTAYYTPVVISMVVAGIAWKALYTNNGIINQFLQQLGLKNGIPWLTSPKLALWSVMLVTIWKGLGDYKLFPPNYMKQQLLMARMAGKSIGTLLFLSCALT